jgi:hypothetical protein
VRRSAGCARRSPRRSPEDAGSIPATSKSGRLAAIVVGGGVCPIPLEDFERPREGVIDPDATRLWTDPQFQIPRPVVMFHTVNVMNRLVGEEMPSQQLLHHEDVLEDVEALASTRVVRSPNHDIARFVRCQECCLTRTAPDGESFRRSGGQSMERRSLALAAGIRVLLIGDAGLVLTKGRLGSGRGISRFPAESPPCLGWLGAPSPSQRMRGRMPTAMDRQLVTLFAQIDALEDPQAGILPGAQLRELTQ